MFFNHKKPKNVMSVMCGERLINFNIWYKRITLITPLGIFVIEKCINPNLKWIQIINLYPKKKKNLWIHQPYKKGNGQEKNL